MSFLMPTYPPPPARFVRGSGTELFDDAGRRYLDFLCGIAVTSLGHAHPAVVAAVTAQAGRLWHVSNLFGNELADHVAERIDRLIGGGAAAGGQVFFGNSGAEANECAIKLVRRHSAGERHVVVSAHGSFHGRTLAALAATGQVDKQVAFRPMPEGFRHVEYDDVAALESELDKGDVAAVLLEAIQGEGGVVVPAPGYLAAVRALCDAAGALLVVDEVQTGLGRTGNWFGFQADGVLPDIVTIAKALGNGMPIGACWARSGVAGSFRPGDHASTFGGQPLACSAAAATLDVMIAEDVPGRARRRGAQLAGGLAGLPGVAAVRGRGLLLGAVLEPVLELAGVISALLAAGVVVGSAGAGVLRLAPPLLVSEDEVDEALELIGQVLAAGIGAAG